MSAALDAAVACHRRGDVAGARDAARRGLADQPDAVALLHFLGMVELQAGDVAVARGLFERAVAVAPGGAPLVSLARLLARSGDWPALAALDHAAPAGAMGDEFLSLRVRASEQLGSAEGLAAALHALWDRHRDDAALGVATARALADAGRHGEAEAVYRGVLADRPAEREALLGLVGLLESLGRSGELGPVLAAARSAGAEPALVRLGEAIDQRERGDYRAALAAIEQAEGVLPTGTWHQMRGELADRAGVSATAFAAFEAMNRADAAAQPEAAEGVRRFRASVAAARAALAKPIALEPAGERAPPLFLLGFPRSGTTLLDTFLMGHPDVEVHEERPFLETAAALGEGSSIAAKRDAYWKALDREAARREALQVDKYPLASARALLIHQLFPDARFLFALRHPCDVVLSCFMTRFRLNWGVASFLTIEDAAVLYDAVMALWVETRAQLSLDVLDVRYEELVADPARVIARVTQFAGLAGDAAMLDHQATARRRGMITTPSFAQVLEPVSARAVGRWKRYRARLEPVLPLLAPWCERFGYSIDD